MNREGEEATWIPCFTRIELDWLLSAFYLALNLPKL